MTATRIVAIPLGENLKLVILDHGIGEEVVGNLVELLGKTWVIGPINLDFNRFADADGTDPFEAEMFHGAAGGYSGRIENGGFRHDGDNSFHEANENRAGSSSRQVKRGKMRKIINEGGLPNGDRGNLETTQAARINDRFRRVLMNKNNISKKH